MRRWALVLAISCSSKTEQATEPAKAWTEVPYNPPIRSERMHDNPFNANVDPKNAFASDVDMLFRPGPDGKVADQVFALYDGTTTLFLLFKGCNHEQLARRLMVIGGSKAARAGFKVLACSDVPAAIAIQ